MDNIGHSPSQTGGKFFAGDKGYLTYEWDSPTVFAILHTVVEEPYRGQGIAKALLDAAVAFARENGYKIRLHIPEHTHPV